jgi:hypothetical protein
MAGSMQLAGATLIAGSLALGIGVLIVSLRPVVAQALSREAAALLLLAAALLIPSLWGMYAVQADEAGTIGLVGQALLTTGLLLPVLVAATPLLHPFVEAPIGEHPLVFALGLALTVGLLLTSIATYQADVVPRPASALLLVSTIGFFVVFFIAEFLPSIAGQVASASFGLALTVGLAWVGLDLWQRA